MINRFPGPTWTSSHVYGAALCNHSRKLIYINIPKCASMWMRAYLAQLGNTSDNVWEDCNFTDSKVLDYTPVIILRNPVQRWISNCPASNEIVLISKNQRLVENIFDNFDSWLTDEHNAPQSDFISGVELDRAIFFYCDQNLSSNIQHYFKTQNFDTVPPDPVNQQLKELQMQSQAWQNILNISQYFDVFKEKYSADYELINKVRFYQDGQV